jgi:hypothetical protein
MGHIKPEVDFVGKQMTKFGTERNHLPAVLRCVNLRVALAALHLRSGGSLPIPRSLQLADQSCLLELGEHAGDLTHGDLERIVRLGEIVAGTGQDPNTALDQRDYAGLLNDQLARKPRSILDQPGVTNGAAKSRDRGSCEKQRRRRSPRPSHETRECRGSDVAKPGVCF